MTFSDCLFRKACREISPACGQEGKDEAYNCYEHDETALAPSKASALWDIAEEFEGLSQHIKEYLREEHPSLPMIMDFQEFFERYKKYSQRTVAG